MWEFRFKNKSSLDFGISLFEINKYPILNKLKFEEVEIPGKKGTYKFPNGYEDRVCEIEILINDEDRLKRIDKIDELVAWLNGTSTLTILKSKSYENMTVVSLDVEKKGKFSDVLKIVFKGE